MFYKYRLPPDISGVNVFKLMNRHISLVISSLFCSLLSQCIYICLKFFLYLFAQNNNVQGAFDGKGIINMNVTKGPTAGFAALGTDSYGLVDFDNFKLDTKSNGQKIMKKYFKNLSV